MVPPALRAFVLLALLSLRLKGNVRWWICASIWVAVETGFEIARYGVPDGPALLLAFALRTVLASLFIWLLELLEPGQFYWFATLILGLPAMLLFS